MRLVKKVYSETQGQSYDYVSSHEIDLAQLIINDDATPFTLYFLINMHGMEKIVVNMTARVTLVPDDDKHMRSYESLPAPVNHICCPCNNEMNPESVQQLKIRLVEFEAQNKETAQTQETIKYEVK